MKQTRSRSPLPPRAKAVEEEERKELALKKKWADVSQMRKQREEGLTSLSQTLGQLSNLSTATTRRLDYTYYGLLTALSNLSRSVGELHALATGVKQMQVSWLGAMEEVESEIDVSVLATAERLDQQAERVGALQGRMRRGKGRVEELGRRLEVVRGRVEGAERRDGEGRRRVGRRMRWLWSLGGCWVGVLVLGLGMRYWGVSLGQGMGDGAWEVLGRREWEGRSGLGGGGVPEVKSGGTPLVTEPVVAKSSAESRTGLDAEMTLGMLDDL